MSEKKSQFIEVDTLSDSQYVAAFGSGVDRKISKDNLFKQIKDESFSPFIYPSIELLQAADLDVDVDNPNYARCEETEYRLYKITNAAPGVDDIVLNNGNTATYQIEYRDTGFVTSVATAATGALAVFTVPTGQELDKSVVPTNTGKAFIQATDSGSVSFPRKNADNTVTMRSAAQYFDDIKQNATNGFSGVIKTADGTSTLAQVATDEAITPANLATLKASNAETLAGTDDTKYVTSENLQSKFANDGILTIATVADISTTPMQAGQIFELVEYHSGSGYGGGRLEAYAGADTPDNGVIFASGTPGILAKRQIKSEFSFYEFGSVEDGVTDDTTAFEAGIAACNTYGVKRIRYSNKLKITSEVIIDQSGIEIMGSPPQYDPNGSIASKPRILFTTSAAKLTFRGVRGTCLKNVYLDGTSVAATPLVLDRVEFSTWENVFVDNVTDTGWVFTETSGVSDVANAWNTFINCGASAPIGMFFSGTNVSGSWHNTFINTTIGYTGLSGIVLTNCDNLTFIQSFISKDSGSGSPVWWRVDTTPATAGNPNSIYFYHLQGSGGAPVIDATCSNPGAIYGFDMSNGFTWPTIPNGARMSITADGINSPGWGAQRFYASRAVNDWRSDTEDAFEFRDDARRGIRLWGLGYGGSSTRLRIDPTTKFGTFYYSFDGSADQLSFSWNTEGLVLKTKTPASASAAGTAGQFAWDANYLYICTATNTWKRVAVATW